MDIRSYMQRNATRNGSSVGLRRDFKTPDKKQAPSPRKCSTGKDKKKRQVDSPIVSDSDSENPVPSKLRKSIEKKQKTSSAPRRNTNRRVVIESDSDQTGGADEEASPKLRTKYTKVQSKRASPAAKKSAERKKPEKRRQKPEILPVVEVGDSDDDDDDDDDDEDDFQPPPGKRGRKIDNVNKSEEVGKLGNEPTSPKREPIDARRKRGADANSRAIKNRVESAALSATRNRPSIDNAVGKLNPISVSDFFNNKNNNNNNNNNTKVRPKGRATNDVARKVAEKELYSDDDFNDVLLRAEADLVSPATSTRSKAKTPIKASRSDCIEVAQPEKSKSPRKSPKSEEPAVVPRKSPLSKNGKGHSLLLESAVPDEEWVQCQTTPGASVKRPGSKSIEKKKADTPKKAASPPVTFVSRSAAVGSKRKPDGFTKIIAKKPLLTGGQPPAASESQLLVERYRPTSVKQIVGQQGDRSCVNKLLNWLRNWNAWHITKAKEKRKGFGANDDGSCYKCVLLSGPPGVGKTTSAELCCKELGIGFVAKNASDARNKKALESQIMETVCSHNVNEYYSDTQGSSSQSAHSTVPLHALIMDEVDGMSGNEDRAGVAELIILIKKTKIPIICICNDRQAQKIRSLANYCYDLRFHRPQVSQIKGPMMSLAYKENIKITSQEMEQIVEASNHDIRQVINRLNLLTPRQGDQDAKSSALRTDIALAQKDLTCNIFETVRAIFTDDSRGDSTKKRSWIDKCELFFNDYSLTPLFAFENYLNVESKAAKKMSEKLLSITNACDCMAWGDCIEKQLRNQNNWSLLNDQAIFSVVAPAEYVKGYLKGMAQYPQWFGKNSKQNKVQRILTQLQMHTSLKTCCNPTSFNLDYAPLLRDKILRPLIADDARGVDSVMQILAYYDLTKEDMDDLLETTQYPNSVGSMAKVAPKVKAALTRSYNKKPPMLPFSSKMDSAITKKKKGAAVQKAAVDADIEQGLNEEEEMEDEDAIRGELIDFDSV